MAERIVRIHTAEIGKDISNFMIGLVTLTVRERVEDAICAGSGTLVTIGRVDGLLTAAHVLDALPSTGEVGIVLYKDGALQKQTIKIQNTGRVIIKGDTFGPNGPDLGFLRLPPENVGWLKATNSFFNLSKRRDQVLSGKALASNCVDAVVGMVDERTREMLVDQPLRRAKAFSALFSDGYIVKERIENGFDIMEFAATSYPDFALPTSFGGMSGGALWRIYFEESDGTAKIVDRRLIGIPFYEAASGDGTPTVMCHGPHGIYGALHAAVLAKWPDAALNAGSDAES